MSYGNSFYQKPPPLTQESKIEAMLDKVLEGQQSMTVDFNGKIDDTTQITLRSELLSQIRGSNVVLRDQIHRDSRITQ